MLFKFSKIFPRRGHGQATETPQDDSSSPADQETHTHAQKNKNKTKKNQTNQYWIWQLAKASYRRIRADPCSTALPAAAGSCFFNFQQDSAAVAASASSPHSTISTENDAPSRLLPSPTNRCRKTSVASRAPENRFRSPTANRNIFSFSIKALRPRGQSKNRTDARPTRTDDNAFGPQQVLVLDGGWLQ